MIELPLTDDEFSELMSELLFTDDTKARKKCRVVFLRAQNLPRNEVEQRVGVDADTVTHWVKKYAGGGLKALLETHHPKPVGALDAHRETLKRIFSEQPPHTVNQALRRLPNSQVFD